MTKYRHVRDILFACYSVEVGLSSTGARALLQDMLSSETQRRLIELEVESALTDPDTPWCALLANDDYSVDEFASELDARNRAIELIWNEVFPCRSAPEIMEK